VVAVALVARAVVLAQLNDHPLLQPVGQLDSGVYVDLARQVAAGDLALREATGGEPFFLAPLYVYFLGLVLRLAGGSLLAAKVVQVGLGAAAVALLDLAARPWFGRRAALVAALLLALCGPVVFHEVLFLQAALDPFLAALALFLLSRALVSGGALAWTAAGAGTSLFALNRPNTLLWGAALVLALPIAAGRARWRRSTRDAAALALGLALAIAPTALRNLAVSGEPVLVSSHGGLNFYVGNRAEADGTYRHVPGITPDIRGQARDARRLAEAAAGRTLTARAVDAHFQPLALDWIAGHPLDAARLFLRKLAYVFAATEISLNYSYAYYARDEPTLLRWLAVGAWLLVPLGLLGLADRLWTGAPEDAKQVGGRGGFAVWAIFVPVYTLSVAAFFVSSRYRLPLLVPLAAGAGFALVRLHELARAHAARRLALYATALLPLLALALWPHPLDDGRSEERTVMLLWLVDNGRVDEALRRLPATLAAHPDPAQLRMRIGQALLEAGRAADAMPHLRAALDAGRLSGAASLLAVGPSALALRRPDLALPFLDGGIAKDPRSAALREKRGLALVMLQRPTEARTELEEACRLDPKSASARLNLAVLEAQEGRLDAARALASEALRLQPDYLQARGLLAELERVR
jgi:4-amino-4-deoxy-L-arabinose transferase-like glycosyltransferase